MLTRFVSDVLPVEQENISVADIFDDGLFLQN